MIAKTLEATFERDYTLKNSLANAAAKNLVWSCYREIKREEDHATEGVISDPYDNFGRDKREGVNPFTSRDELPARYRCMNAENIIWDTEAVSQLWAAIWLYCNDGHYARHAAWGSERKWGEQWGLSAVLADCLAITQERRTEDRLPTLEEVQDAGFASIEEYFLVEKGAAVERNSRNERLASTAVAVKERMKAYLEEASAFELAGVDELHPFFQVRVVRPIAAALAGRWKGAQGFRYKALAVSEGKIVWQLLDYLERNPAGTFFQLFKERTVAKATNALALDTKKRVMPEKQVMPDERPLTIEEIAAEEAVEEAIASKPKPKRTRKKKAAEEAVEV